MRKVWILFKAEIDYRNLFLVWSRNLLPNVFCCSGFEPNAIALKPHLSIENLFFLFILRFKLKTCSFLKQLFLQKEKNFSFLFVIRQYLDGVKLIVGWILSVIPMFFQSTKINLLNIGLLLDNENMYSTYSSIQISKIIGYLKYFGSITI